MLRFVEFGNTALIVDKIFGCQRDTEGATVSVYSDRGGPIELTGDDARLFSLFVREHTITAAEATEEQRLIIGPLPMAPRPSSPPDVKKSAKS